MAALVEMPPIQLPQAELHEWGGVWLGDHGSLNAEGVARPKRANCFDKKQGMDFGQVFDLAFAHSVAAMLGNIEVLRRDSNDLIPPKPDVMEVGKTRIVGGIRPQNYDASYRPDGPRIVFDSKTLIDCAHQCNS